MKKVHETIDPFAIKPSAYKVDDWALHDHKIVVIKKIEEGRVTEVSTGYISTSGYDLSSRLFPFNLKGKLISEEFEQAYKDIHDAGVYMNLNFPDISNMISSKWVQAMRQQDNSEYVMGVYNDLKSFVLGFKDSIRVAKSMTVQGVKLFRQ